jgi:sigma-B regulation protein RsbU (phosphoserine phosphatase)
MIGAFRKLKYKDSEATLGKGDILVLYTDGITEARCNRSFFGEERLIDSLKGLKSVKTEDMPKLIFDDVQRCTKGKLSDDVVLFTVSLEGESL